MSDNSSNNAYWSTNLRIILVSLVIWALVSFGFGILLRPMLSGIAVGGTDLASGLLSKARSLSSWRSSFSTHGV